jgi:Tannase and feruloyl esterase
MQKFMASMESRTRSRSAFATALLCSVALGPFALPVPANARPPQPIQCSALAAWVQKEAGSALNLIPFTPVPGSGAAVPGGSMGGGSNGGAPNGQTLSAANPVIAAVVPAKAPDLSYCAVVFQIKPAITIEIGLPLNTVDGGTGGTAGGCGNTLMTNNKCVEGNWNGRIDVVGNGGFSGSVPGVTSATNVGFVGSSTDNGHSLNWCSATNPATGQTYGQPGIQCGFLAGFALDPNDKLLSYQITDFIDGSEVLQTTWALALTKAYYGQSQSRTYFTGCSTGGRQAMQMAQFHPEFFDGILAGAPAFNWNRFIIGDWWPSVVMAAVDPADCPAGTAASCLNGANTTFQNAFTAANAAAVGACDGNDGVLDGVINEPRECFFDAKSLVGQRVAPMTSPMTEAEAQAIDMIWAGPFNKRGQRLWGGVAYGTNASAVGDNVPSASYIDYWMEQNPNFDLTTITTNNFATFFQLSDRKFADTTPPPPGFVAPAATDSVDLGSLINHGTKLIHYRGLADPTIFPFGSWNYDTRLFEKYGVADTEKFYRSYYFPGNGHCNAGYQNTNGGFPNAGMMDYVDLFNELIGWVENGASPGAIVAYTAPGHTGNTTLICPAPNRTVYNGGPITSASSYSCTDYRRQPPDLAAYDQTAAQYHEAP